VATDSPPIPSLLPPTRWSRLPASYGGSGSGIEGRKLSLIAIFIQITPRDSGCPSGDSDRGLTNLRFSLQPRRPNKSPWISESRKQNENPESISSPIYTVLIILIQNCNPMLRAYKSLNLPKQQQLVTPFYGMVGGGGFFFFKQQKLPLQQQINTTPYMFVLKNNSILINIL
jgi:hypothetical protein